MTRKGETKARRIWIDLCRDDKPCRPIVREQQPIGVGTRHMLLVLDVKANGDVRVVRARGRALAGPTKEGK